MTPYRTILSMLQAKRSLSQRVPLAIAVMLGTVAAAGAAPANNTANPSHATAQSGRQLALQAAVGRALATNPTTRSSRAGRVVASGQTRQARAALLPHLSGQVTQSHQRDNLEARGFDFGSSFSSLQLPPGQQLSFPSTVTYNRFQAELSLKQKVFDYSAWQRYHAAKQGERAARARVGAARNQVAAQTERQYVSVLAANQRIAAARADLTLARQLLSLAKSQKRVGVATGVDVARAKTRKARARSRLDQARTHRTRSALQLKRTIGMDLGQPLNLADQLQFMPVPLTTADGAVSRAMANRNDIQQARNKIKQARKRLSAARSRRLPTVSIQGAYGTAGNTPTQNEAATYRVGAQLSVPLFNGGAIAGRVDSAAGELSQQRINLSDRRRQVEQSVRMARRTLKTLAAEVRSARTNLEQSKAELDQARARFKSGTRDNIAVINAQSALASARRQRVGALADYTRARVNRVAALGLAQRFRIDRAMANNGR